MTTRTTRSLHVARARAAIGCSKPARSSKVLKPSLRYRIERLIGEGGFRPGLSRHAAGASPVVPATVCVKVSTRIDGWLREAYFGQLLDDHPRAIRVFDIFPHMRGDASVLYYLVLEYAAARRSRARIFTGRKKAGRSAPSAARSPESSTSSRKLHRGQLLHRDLTPVNVFVCDGPRLKLGDFGIVRQQSDRRGITAHTMNAMTAPSDILARAAPKWQARDDVYQVGQLLGMLVRGNATERIRHERRARRCSCSDHLKEIVHRCIGERRKRYESADEMIEALRNPPAELKTGVLRTLKGVHLAFTGISRPAAQRRRSRAAKRAGAIVHGMPSARTTVVVRGRPNAQQAAGRDGGLKLMEIKRLREKGHRITLLNETQFWRLAAKR